MLDVFDRIAEIDNRYATDQELQELEQISQELTDRLRLYQKLLQAEEQILAELYKRVLAIDPHLFLLDGRNVASQCQRDVRHTFHQSIQSMLLGETWLQDNLLLWFQSVIRSFKIQPRCELVYSTLETLLQAALPPQESQIICPIIRRVKECLTQP
ncbi:hypothetical protein [Leptolyngbya ohadii]|uniref:hypothetical protein n=1 Tax=Leptolyngbya ohadii TaxID=1962290 RepID=UPI0015C66C0E|nr:hypothetical protein [Leptolyngbya ohadii]